MTNVKVELNEVVMMVEGYRRQTVHRGKVIKIGRVWIDVKREDQPARDSQRYRLDTQTDGGQYVSSPRFYTLAQWAEMERHEQAARVLREQDISINSGSPWRGREVELAALLTAAQLEHEGS